LSGEPKELVRAVALEVWGNRYAVKALEKISKAYREILDRISDDRMRRRIAQWSASKLAKILGAKASTHQIHIRGRYI